MLLPCILADVIANCVWKMFFYHIDLNYVQLVWRLMLLPVADVIAIARWLILADVIARVLILF